MKIRRIWQRWHAPRCVLCGHRLSTQDIQDENTVCFSCTVTASDKLAMLLGYHLLIGTSAQQDYNRIEPELREHLAKMRTHGIRPGLRERAWEMFRVIDAQIEQRHKKR